MEYPIDAFSQDRRELQAAPLIFAKDLLPALRKKIDNELHGQRVYLIKELFESSFLLNTE
jgi:hypothetical protein